jgi:hypothetical protein
MTPRLTPATSQESGIDSYKETPATVVPGRCGGPPAPSLLPRAFGHRVRQSQGFAGQDIETAVFYPEDDRFLIERDLTVRHYEIAGG